MSPEEEEYLSELTRAYLLGREHSRREDKDEQNHSPSVERATSPMKSTAPLITPENNNNLPLLTSVNVKHDRFLHEPIGTKTTQVLPGIGSKYAHQLSECGFRKVRRLLGFYLMIKDDQQFVQWLNTKVKISIHSAWLCTHALRAWCQEHL